MSRSPQLAAVVGAKTAKALEKLDIRAVEDLLRHYPRRYVERGELSDIGSLQVDEHVTVLAEVKDVRTRSMRQRKGTIVVISSLAGHFAPPELASYSTAKHALTGLTKSMARDYGPLGVRVNCVSPGWIDTGNTAKLTRRDQTQNPAGRVGKPEDIAEIVAFLLDRERSGFVTGANFVVDGGMTRKMIYAD